MLILLYLKFMRRNIQMELFLFYRINEVEVLLSFHTFACWLPDRDEQNMRNARKKLFTHIKINEWSINTNSNPGTTKIFLSFCLSSFFTFFSSVFCIHKKLFCMRTYSLLTAFCCIILESN